MDIPFAVWECTSFTNFNGLIATLWLVTIYFCCYIEIISNMINDHCHTKRLIYVIKDVRRKLPY